MGVAASAPTARADQSFLIAFTRDWDLPPDRAEHGRAPCWPTLPDGAMVTIECELESQPVNNGMSAISVWAKTNVGYLPTAFIHTGAEGWMPGVVKCSTPSQGTSEDESTDPTLQVKTSAPTSREFEPNITPQVAAPTPESPSICA